jgi:hypothetical protein
LTDIDTVFWEFAVIVPDVAFNASQPTLSVALQVSDWLLVFFSVTDAFVAVLPKSTTSGETANFAVVPEAATVIDTETISVPPPLFEEIVTLVV